MKTAEGRVAAFQFLLPAIHRITDKIERSVIAGDVAGYLGIEAGLVLENFRKAAAERREKTLAAPKEPVRHDEKVLLKLFLGSKEARTTLIPELQSLGAFERFSIRRIFEALIALHSSGAPFGLAELDARLEEADRTALSAIALDDEGPEEEISLDQGAGIVEHWRRRMLEIDIAALKMRIKNAERSGDTSGALRLYEDLQRFERSQRMGGVQ
jgi:DNA primase